MLELRNLLRKLGQERKRSSAGLLKKSQNPLVSVVYLMFENQPAFL